MHRIGRAIALTASVTAGCTQIPHNDVVIFATNTKVALDIAPSPTAGNVPTFTLGYKREEGVWMPLVVNGQSSVPLSGAPGCRTKAECASVVSAAQRMFAECMKQSGSTASSCLGGALKGIKYVGSEGDRKDTYSVFASFGADFGATGGGRAALSQFFATGIAAQHLAEDPDITRALVVKEPAAEVVDDARALLRAKGAQEIEDIVTVTVATQSSVLECWIANKAAYASAAESALSSKYPALIKALKDQTSTGEALVKSHLMTMMLAELKDFAPLNAQICP